MGFAVIESPLVHCIKDRFQVLAALGMRMLIQLRGWGQLSDERWDTITQWERGPLGTGCHLRFYIVHT